MNLYSIRDEKQKLIKSKNLYTNIIKYIDGRRSHSADCTPMNLRAGTFRWICQPHVHISFFKPN